MTAANIAVVADLGGTSARYGVATTSGRANAIEVFRLPLFDQGRDERVTLHLICEQVTSFYSRHGSELGPRAPFVLAFPGPVVPPRTILAAPTLVGRNIGMTALPMVLETLLGREVRVLNDVSAAAWWYSTLLPNTSFMVVTVSSGIGSKVYIPGAGVLDGTAYSGEIGHQVFASATDSPRCDCGGQGHLGALSSGRGIERAARERAKACKRAFEVSICGQQFSASPDELTNEAHLVPAALRGDKWVLKLLEEATAPLAQAIVCATLAMGIERVIIIGGFALALGAVYLEILREQVRLICPPPPYGPDPFLLVQLGEATNQACLLGAAVYASKVLYSEHEKV